MPSPSKLSWSPEAQVAFQALLSKFFLPIPSSWMPQPVHCVIEPFQLVLAFPVGQVCSQLPSWGVHWPFSIPVCLWITVTTHPSAGDGGCGSFGPCVCLPLPSYLEKEFCQSSPQPSFSILGGLKGLDLCGIYHYRGSVASWLPGVQDPSWYPKSSVVVCLWLLNQEGLVHLPYPQDQTHQDQWGTGRICILWCISCFIFETCGQSCQVQKHSKQINTCLHDLFHLCLVKLYI